MESTIATIERGFATGEHVVLRPVLEADLAELAKLMAEAPYEHAPTPWTYQRLKQKFEDKEKPGLWDRENKVYAVLRRAGGVVGYIRETIHKQDMYWGELHLAGALADRDQLGRDLAAAYLRYQQRWHRPRRISFAMLLAEKQKVGWLLDAGFEQELIFGAAALYHGEQVAITYVTWIADWALAARGERHVVAGEDSPRSR